MAGGSHASRLYSLLVLILFLLLPDCRFPRILSLPCPTCRPTQFVIIISPLATSLAAWNRPCVYSVQGFSFSVFVNFFFPLLHASFRTVWGMYIGMKMYWEAKSLGIRPSLPHARVSFLFFFLYSQSATVTRFLSILPGVLTSLSRRGRASILWFPFQKLDRIHLSIPDWVSSLSTACRLSCPQG